jgi:hypothetical protein
MEIFLPVFILAIIVYAINSHAKKRKAQGKVPIIEIGKYSEEDYSNRAWPNPTGPTPWKQD